MESSDQTRLRRENQVEPIIRCLLPQPALNELVDPNKLPLNFFMVAVERYVSGNFSDCILQSAMSVEMALLLKLDKKLTYKEKQFQKQTLHGQALSFGRLIKMSRQKQIIDTEFIEQVSVIHNLRNIFVHPANMVAFVLGQKDNKVFEKMLPKWKEKLAKKGAELSDSQRAEVKSAYGSLKKIVDEKIGSLPALEWAAHQPTLNFQQERLQDYYDKMVGDLLSSGLIENLGANTQEGIKNLPAYINVMYPYHQEIAFDALEIAGNLLRKIGYP